MVGGGQGAFIGAVHRAAAALDGLYDLQCAALSSDPGRARESALGLGLTDRGYSGWREMLDRERSLPPERRVEAVSIVTPNHTHHEIARAFIDAGFHVLIDKPMTTTVEQACDLAAAAERAGVVAAVTYNYSGYPMVRQAAEMVRAGAVGAVRRVYVEHHQGWLATKLEAAGQKQATWRTDPSCAGAGAIGDIGTHAEHLLRFVTGLEIEAVCADVNTFVPGRRVDDDAAALLRLTGGARAALTISQVCVGEQNNLNIRIHGELGSIEWRQESPDFLEFRRLDGLRQTLTRGMPSLGVAAAAATRLPTGHPEGFIEAFANIYKDVAFAVLACRTGARHDMHRSTFPTALDGLRGVRFVERVQAAARSGVWTAWND
ncbi:MAG: Gfo/Idh/MocA family oxidoreductase [Phycisphaerales bacterium]|nr:Gfo/Idh/MocA family oxidoreductase [Phycisphaerales bacterium]